MFRSIMNEERKQGMKKAGICYTLASAIIFGIIPMLTKYVYAYDVSSLTITFFRSFLVLFLLASMMKIRNQSFLITKKEVLLTILVSWFGSGLTMILLNQAYLVCDTGVVTNLHFLYPLFTALLCRILFREHMMIQKMAALCLAVLGCISFLQDSNHGTILGSVMAIASGITYAGYLVFMEKWQLTRMQSMKLTFYTSLWISIEMIVMQIWMEPITFLMSGSAYGLLSLIALLSCLSVIWMQKGVLLIGSSNASVFCLMEPLTSLLCGFLFLSESLSIYKLIGCACLVFALLLFVFQRKK